ncbi:MAG TPA: DUF167 domain-containing protein [Candidatus Limnocylindria bacterium]|nr:DUF167 domain-containing protein [Candidatus Limnocylindria bacterium]
MAEIDVAVVPRAAANSVGPYADGLLRVRVTRPPADGEANRAVLRLVARALHVAPSRLELVSGARGRRKRIHITGLDDAELRRRLDAIGGD